MDSCRKSESNGKLRPPATAFILRVGCASFSRECQYERIHRNVNLYHDAVDTRDGSLNGSILYGYRFNWQTAFYAGYSGDRLLLDGNHYQRSSSDFFIKLAYAFEP